ncbi:hypothetical protein VCHA35O137_40261 [Vibrio chagasii]|nr:hypothetical protein VCHA35O137_40261 [Vibrio chagasii]
MSFQRSETFMKQHIECVLRSVHEAQDKELLTFIISSNFEINVQAN